MLDERQHAGVVVLLRNAHRILGQTEGDIGAAAESQRAGSGVIVFDDASDENVVIARVDHFLHAAIEPDDNVGEDWATGDARRPVDGGEAIGRWRAESGRDCLLIFGKNIHGEALCLLEYWATGRPFRQAHEYQRRIEGNGGKGIRSKTPRRTLAIHRRHHRHAGGEGAEGAAQIHCIDGTIHHGDDSQKRCGEKPIVPAMTAIS